MAAPQIQGTPTTAQQDTAVTQFTINKPTGAAVDEYLFMFCRFNIQTTAFTDVQGFTQAIRNNAASANAQYVFYKKVDGTEGSSFTFVHGSSTVHAMMVRLSGVHLTTAIDDAQGVTQVATVDNIDMPTVTTTGADRLIFWAASNISPTSVNWTPDTLDTNELVDSQPAGNSAWAVTWEEQATAGASGTRNALWGGTGSGQNAVGVAVIPAPSVPTETLVPTAGGLATNLNGGTYDATRIDEPTGSDDGLWLAGVDPSGTPTTNGPEYVDTQALWTGSTAHTWTTPANATDTSETTAATYALGANTTDYMDHWAWNAADWTDLPAGAVITDVSLDIRIMAGTANRLTAWVQLATANGTLAGSEVAVNAGGTIPTTAGGTVYTYTTADGLHLPTRAQLVTGTYGVRTRLRRSNAVTASLYSLKMTVTYVVPSTTNTTVVAPMSDPVDALATGAGTGTMRIRVGKLGTGANPQARLEVYETTNVNTLGTLLATPIADTTVSALTSAGGTVLTGTFDQSVIGNKNNVVVRLVGTGAAGGLVDVGAINWVAQTTVVSGTPHTRSINDTVAVADSAALAMGRGRTVADAVAVADLAARNVVFIRPLTDTAGVADTATRAVGRLRTITDTATVADAVTKASGYSRSATDAVTVADTATRATGKGRTITDAVTVADTAARALAAARAINDTVAVADAATRLVTYLRAATDTVAVADSASRALTRLVSRSITDAVAVADSAARTVTYVRALNDIVTAADAVTKVANRTRAITDAVGVADTATRVAAYARPVTDTVGVADSATRALTSLISRSVTDAVGIADTATRTVAYSRPVTDAVGIADTAVRTLARLRSITDAVAVADTATRTVAYLRAVSDAVGIADNRIVQSAGIVSRQITDAVAVADTVAKVQAHARALNDAVAVADTAIRAVARVRTVSDAVAVADTATRAVARVRSITDAVGVADTATRVLFTLVQRTISDAVAIADTIARTVAYTRPLTDTVTAADTVTRVAAYRRPLTDTVGVADLAARSAGRTRAITDTVAVADTALRSAGRSRTVADALTVADSVTRQAAYVRAFADAVAVGDEALAGAVMRRAILDAVGVADLAIAFKPPTDILFPPAGRVGTVRASGRIGRPEGNRVAIPRR